jgi:acyl carrier protein
MKNIVYFDLETQKSAAEVGGWDRKRDMKMSVGVTFSTGDGQYHIFPEDKVNDLVKQLTRADLVVGFNIINFDYEVLHGYTPLALGDTPTLDLMADLEQKLGHRLSLDALAKATLNAPKVADLVKQLMRADLVVGFNIINFDYEVLHGYTPLDLHATPTLDLMADLEQKLGHRLSLDALAKATLNAPKVADGMQALKWWKEGRIMDIAEYCCYDVKITKELHEHGKQFGEVSYLDRLGQKRTVKVKW